MIVVDTREPKEIIEMLTSLGLEVKCKQLKHFDYIVGVVSKDGSKYIIPVERKEIHDYIASILDGRLNNQLFYMSHLAELSYLCVIGLVSEVLLERVIDRRAYIGSLVSASLKRASSGKSGQVVVVNLETDHDFVLFLHLLHKRLEEGRLERTLRPPHVSKTNLKEALIAMYSCIPGVGIERAKKLAEKFDSLEKLMNASVDDIMSVDGFGKKLSEKVFSFIHGR